MESIYCSDDEYRGLTQNIDQLVQDAENLSHSEAKELVFSLLQSLDLLHREGLTRLFQLIEKEHPDFKEKMKQDFTIKTLFGLYDLFEHEMINESEENGQLSHSFKPAESSFMMQEKQPIWMPGGNVHKMQSKQLYGQNFEGEKILMCKVNGEVYVVQNSCLDSILPLEFGKVEDHDLVCPWHGCRYDLRTGKLEGSPNLKLKTYPVEMEDDGKFKIGFNIPSENL